MLTPPISAPTTTAAPSASVNTAVAAESATWYATSSVVNRLLSGTRQYPALKHAYIASSNSGRLRISTPTRSPRCTPSDASPCASAFVRRSNSAYVSSRLPQVTAGCPGSLRAVVSSMRPTFIAAHRTMFRASGARPIGH